MPPCGAFRRLPVGLVTLTVSRLLHSEFRTIKNLYIIGMLCFIGFGFTVAISLSIKYIAGLKTGLVAIMFYLGACKSAIIMWIYGVTRFSTDIQFWLGFMPTKFYILCWIFTPIVLMIFFINKMFSLFEGTLELAEITALTWIGFTLLVVIIFTIRTVANYMVQSNFISAFKSSLKYGPPDPDERKRRKKYNITMNLRQCEHNCIMLDDRFDCNHVPVTYQTQPDGDDTEAAPEKATSLTKIYQSTQTRRTRTSSLIDIQSLHYD